MRLRACGGPWCDRSPSQGSARRVGPRAPSCAACRRVDHPRNDPGRFATVDSGRPPLGSGAMRTRTLTSLGAWAFTVAAVLLTIVGLLYPLAAPLFATGADAGPDPVRITDYRADFQVSDSGRLDAVETITAEFPYGRHGIFRFFDLSDPSDSHVRLKPEDIEV